MFGTKKSTFHPILYDETTCAHLYHYHSSRIHKKNQKGVDPEWGRHTPLHQKSNPLLNPLLLQEWSVPNQLHSMCRSGVWSGLPRSGPVSGLRPASVKGVEVVEPTAGR